MPAPLLHKSAYLQLRFRIKHAREPLSKKVPLQKDFAVGEKEMLKHRPDRSAKHFRAAPALLLLYCAALIITAKSGAFSDAQ